MDDERLRALAAPHVPEDAAAEIAVWAVACAHKFALKNIVNTKTSNTEETNFDPAHNIGIEYSKDTKNRLSYKNKRSLELVENDEYAEIRAQIRATNGLEQDALRYLLFAVRCVVAGVPYDIDEVRDHDYSEYFNVLDEKYNLPCPSCKSKNTMPMMIQTRAADEPPLIRYACKNCQKSFNPPRFCDKKQQPPRAQK
ncbi:putative RNA polymerase subunit RPO30 [Parapoxvirus red deer/HL953]|uniref:DNA-directed RNA polymerase 30 kDa polypeptide n=1 Tax=Parapoxvirus red deer/HL953 TaxID=1579460 RepID=A0A0A7MC22_9POXV|nr:putative RNA polymerase subunit RPO30 [Parapoxvirus red deer/HL953]AIZ77272.1 putative RNA polymerase subunit RPO30 [Parapoxvirus red deer/HL953]